MFQGRTFAALAVAAGALTLAPAAASAGTLTVDDDRAQCPSAPYTSIQSAVDAAQPGDVVAICGGLYAEGRGTPGTNALTIDKDLTLRGVGADLVTIQPKAGSGGQIAESALDLRNGVGDVVAITGAPLAPTTVHVTGVTVDGGGVFTEAGIVFLDAQGSVKSTRVTGVVTSQLKEAHTQPGGYRNNDFGFGIAQVTTAPAGASGVRPLEIAGTRVDEYGKAGVLVTGATGEALPLTSTGVEPRLDVAGSQIVGRLQCTNYVDNGNCAAVNLLTDGPLYGQDGIRVAGGATATVRGSLVSQNLVNGTGAPTRGSTANNANLKLGAGLRFLGASTSVAARNTLTGNNIVDNAYGVLNLGADGTDASATGRIPAENNWWGLGFQAVTNPGPAISPTTNPAVPENGVNGTPITDTNGTLDPADDGPSSTLVDTFPFRNGNQANATSGQFPILDAPAPVTAADLPPSVQLTAPATVQRGETFTIAATATDDFGVQGVTFYGGGVKITEVPAAPYELSIQIPADAPCGPMAFTAIAKDAIGQTAVASATTVVHEGEQSGPACAKPVPVPPFQDPVPQTPAPVVPVVPAVPAAPTVAFAAAPKTLATAGTVFAANPSAAAGVAKVELFLGTRKVCTVTAAPYACRITPTGAEVGTQSVLAVVTDARGRTATAAASVTVPRFRPTGFRLAVASKSLKGGRVAKALAGKLGRPAGVTAKQGCASGSVTVVVKRGRTTIANTQVKLAKDCTFVKRLTLQRRRGATYTVTARFAGNTVLAPASSTGRFS